MTDPSDDGMPMSWIEIICVHPDGRGSGVSGTLINKFIEHSKAISKSNQLVLGLDIVGTSDGGINLGLRKIYEQLCFKFDMPGNKGQTPMMFHGAQFAGKMV